MKKRLLSILMTGLVQYSVNGQTADTLYEVATWKGFAQSAVTYTWDDNTAKQLSDALPLYDRYGFKVTFFTITSTSPNWNGLKQAQNNGHEVGSHTVTHTALSTLTDADQENEEKNSQQEINTQLANSKCKTIAYPYCTSGTRSITDKYYISARGCSGQIESKTPADFLNISSIVCGPQGSISTAVQFNSSVNNAAAINGWVVFLLHGINNDGGFSPIDSSELGKHIEYVGHNKSKFWVSTYGNVVRYIRERNVAAVHELSASDSLITFSLTQTLDTIIYNVPLTLKRPVPENWNTFTLSQNGKMIPVNVVNDNGKLFMIMDVVPNAGNVLIRNTGGTTGIAINSSVSSFTVNPNPFNSSSTIRFELEKAASVSLVLLDQSGKRIKSIATGMYAAGTHEEILDASSLTPGIFYCTLYVNEEVLVKKVICKK